MNCIIKEVTIEQLKDYSLIPIKTYVSSEYHVKENGNGFGLILKEVDVYPYIYDLEEDPLSWVKKFDVSNWGFFLVYDNDKPIAGMTLAYNTNGVNMLANRNDLTVLWDIRVCEEYKSKGIGTELFKYAIEWAKERDCNQLKIETQAHNVVACNFYSKMGCHLGEINKYAYYPDDEVMIIWYYDLKV